MCETLTNSNDMTIYRLIAETNDVSLQTLNEMAALVKEKYQIEIFIAEIDPKTRCCEDARWSNGWRHANNCKNFVCGY